MNRFMQSTALVLAAAMSSAACVEDIPDLNDPGEDVLGPGAPRSVVAAVASGLLVGARTRIGPANGYISLLGIVGRESYNLDAADPRFVTEMLEGPLDFSSLVFGGGFWIDPYANIRQAIVLDEISSQIDQYSAAEQAGLRGFAKTMQVVDYFMLVSTRDELGAVIDVNPGDLDALGDIVCKPRVLAHMASLLDAARTDLEAAGDAFAFPLSTGFAGFDTPATFLQFNRALLARTQVYAGNFQAALDALDESFITREGDQLELGVYHAFSGNPGDTSNQANTVNIVAHPSIRMDAETSSTTGMIDARVARRLVELGAPVSRAGLSSSDDFTGYEITDAIPIIRNEELILLRAEAHLGLGNTADAADDINWIRANSGGLDPLPESAAADSEELLRQRRYSLMYEGHRWVDQRRLGDVESLLNDDIDRGGEFDPFTVPETFPIPEPEIVARTDENVTVIPCVP